MRDDARDTVAAQVRECGGDARAAGEAGGVPPLLVNGETLVAVIPYGLRRFQRGFDWAVAGVVGTNGDVAVLLGCVLHQLDRQFAARHWIEGVDDRPAPVRR